MDLYTEIVRTSLICPECGKELARERSVWCASVGRHVVACTGRVGEEACQVVIAKGEPWRRQIRRVTGSIKAVIVLIATVILWMGGCAACAIGALLTCIEMHSVARYGAGLSAWASVIVMMTISASGAAAVGGWSRVLRSDGATWRRWVVFIGLTWMWMGLALLMTTAAGDLVSGRSLSAVRWVIWLAVVGLALFWWVGAALGAGARWAASLLLAMMWQRKMQRSRHMRPSRVIG